MEKEPTWPAKTPTASSYLAPRKQKALKNTSSFNFKPLKNSSQCPPSMKPHQIELLIGRPNNHFSIFKVFVLLFLVVFLFLNIISFFFNYPFLHPPILSFSSFYFLSNSSSPPPPPPPSSELNSYSHNLDASLPPPDFNFSPSRPPTIVNSSPPPTISNSPPRPILNSPPPPNFNFSSSNSPTVVNYSPPPTILNSPPPPISDSPPPPEVNTHHPPSPQPSPNLNSSFPSLEPSSTRISSSSPSQQLEPSTRLISSVPSPPPPPPSPSLNPCPPPQSPSSFSYSPPPLTINVNSPPPPRKFDPKPPKIAKECDLSKGEWVRDWQAPYYTNMTCYTIQEHQNCMKYGRPNMDFLKWRWKPDGCELPLFDPNQFLELMRGKTLAFVGDSLARNQMQSLMCLLSQVVYPEDISDNSDDNFKRMYYSTFNFTIAIYWSPFLIRAKQTRGPDRMLLWNFHLDEVDKTWASHIDDFNYVIISGGNWFNRPSIFYQKRRIVGCLYCPSKKVTHRTMHYSHRKAFHTAFQAINKSRKFKGTVILRSVSPSHFENGVWDKGGDCVRTQPFRRNETALSVDDIQIYKDQLKEFHIAKEQGKKKGIDFKLLDTTNAMLLRPDGHPSRYGHWPNAKVTLYNDCVHWCLPGPVDMWNDILLQILNV